MDDIRCTLCDSLVYHQYGIKSADSIKYWYHCSCGCLFNIEHPSANTGQSRKTLESIKNFKDRYEYFARVYAPIIEEKVYKRNMLDVGFGTPVFMKAMEERGWNVNGIDLEPNEYITGDFETYDFFGEKLERFDLIWMSDVIQQFKDPVKAIYKAYQLLNPMGILFICTPNTDLMKLNTYPAWGNWSLDNRQFINESIIKDILARVDDKLSGKMKIILLDPEILCKRFPSWNNMHLIAQKRKIEDIITLDDIKNLKAINEEKKSKVIS